MLTEFSFHQLKKINTACENGIIAGCRVVDVKIDFYDGKMHPVDSKDIAFQTAGKMHSLMHSKVPNHVY